MGWLPGHRWSKIPKAISKSWNIFFAIWCSLETLVWRFLISDRLSLLHLRRSDRKCSRLQRNAHLKHDALSRDRSRFALLELRPRECNFGFAPAIPPLPPL